MVAVPKNLTSQVQPEVVSVVPALRPGTTLHVDADYLAYFAAGGDGMALDICRMIVRERCEKMRVMSGCEKVLLQLSDPRSTKGDRFLISVAQPYQGQRLAGHKTGNWRPTREYIESGKHEIPMKFWKTREADDGAAYCSEHSGGMDAVASKDKDWRMFAAHHLDWDTFQLIVVPPGTFRITGPNKLEYGHYFFWWQLLAGDTADHIPGLKGVGKGTATALLDSCTTNAEAYDVVSARYRAKKRAAWADYLVEQAALLWMRTDRPASLLDFLKVFPDDPDILAAADRMVTRVAEEKIQLEQILNGYIQTESN